MYGAHFHIFSDYVLVNVPLRYLSLLPNTTLKLGDLIVTTDLKVFGFFVEMEELRPYFVIYYRSKPVSNFNTLYLADSSYNIKFRLATEEEKLLYQIKEYL